MLETKQIIEQQIKKLMKLLEVEIKDLQISKDEEYWKVFLDTPENALLIGRHGKTIQSLQLILRFLVHNEVGEWQKILLDIDNYREKREKEVTNLAIETAQKVELSNRPIVLSNLSPFERRVVHMTLADNPNVQTESHGQGKDRKLMVSPK